MGLLCGLRLGQNASLTLNNNSKIILMYFFQGLTIVIVGLIVDPTNNGILAFDQNHSGIIYVSWPGYIIINTIILLGYLIGDRIPKRTVSLQRTSPLV